MMQPDRRRFLLYWLSSWLVLAPFVSLFVNPPSPDAGKAFWNPTVWGMMVSVAGGLAWVLCRCQKQIRAVFDDSITRCFLMACVWVNLAMSAWSRGAGHNSAVDKTCATILFLASLVCIVKGIEESVKRIRAWRAQSASPSPGVSAK